DGFTIKGVQKVLKERGLRHVADVGRGAEPAAPEPVVIEKIVYVDRPVSVPAAPAVVAPAPVAAKKPRASHLRAVPGAMSLPFFAEPVAAKPQRDFPVLDSAPVRKMEPAPSVVETMIETIQD